MKNRNINIDIIKGIGIILMVGGHCGMPFTHFIYLFHMAIFFMASGYCFNASNSETMQDVLSLLSGNLRDCGFHMCCGRQCFRCCIMYLLKQEFILQILG